MAIRFSSCRWRWMSPWGQPPGAGWMSLGALLLGTVAWVGASRRGVENARPAQPAATDGKPTLAATDRPIREGTQITNQLGQFRMTGGRVTFFTADGKQRLIGLENLNLERIARTIAERTQPLQWAVTGTVTEYRGANFLLVRRAILKSQAQWPEPGS